MDSLLPNEAAVLAWAMPHGLAVQSAHPTADWEAFPNAHCVNIEEVAISLERV